MNFRDLLIIFTFANAINTRFTIKLSKFINLQWNFRLTFITEIFRVNDNNLKLKGVSNIDKTI